MRTQALVAVALLFAPCSFAQTATPATASSASAQGQVAPPNIVSPEVHPDHTITFRVLAPNAKKVAVSVEGDAKPLELQQDASGVWSVTTEPKRPDYYGYTFAVDGQRMLDPRNAEIRPNLISPTTVAHVTGDKPLPWEMQDIPHGEVTHIFYRSKLVTPDADDDGYRSIWVYTPPGYDAKRKEKYPVLYLNHGYSDDSNGWTQAGQANLIMDSLLHDGKIKPMVVVMPLGYGTMSIVHAGWNRVGSMIFKNQQLFSEQLLKEVIPMAEGRYNIANDRNHRAIAGLSMGGGHSIYTGLNHPETFAYVGAFSSAVVSPALANQGWRSAANDDEWAKGFEAIVPNYKTQQPLKLYWESCGTEDSLMTANRAFGKWAKVNIRTETPTGVQIRETPGMHTWMVWRDDLVDFTPLLFR